MVLNQVLEDFIKKPIEITIENLSEKYVLKGTLQAFKKEKKNGKKHISKSKRSNPRVANPKLAKVATPRNRNFAKKRTQNSSRG